MTNEKINHLKNSPILKVLIALIALTLSYKIYNWIKIESTDNAYIEADISIVSSEVNGKIIKLLVIDNQKVKAGDRIAEIDDTDYLAALAKAQADFDIAENAIKIAEQKIAIQKLDISSLEEAARVAQVSFDIAQRDYVITSKLTADKFSSQKLLDDSKNVAEKSKLGLVESEINLDSANKNLALLELQKLSDVSKMDAASQNKIIAQHALDSTKIRAPIDGVVASNNIKIGNFVRQGVPLVAVVPVTGLYIKANFKETQVAKFEEGAPALIEIDGLPKLEIKGKVRGVYPASGSKFSLIPSDSATGNFTKVVQRIPVIIDFDIPDSFVGKIKAGMSVTVSIRNP